MRYAIIGCGRISPNHLAAAQKNALEIIGLCDIDDKMLEDKFLKFKLDKTKTTGYSDYRKMIEELKPDLVSICTESGRHAAIALDCIRVGINLIIEKPIALSIEDADAIISEAKKHNEIGRASCRERV